MATTNLSLAEKVEGGEAGLGRMRLRRASGCCEALHVYKRKCAVQVPAWK
jgi:hypothetical protein